MRPMDVELKMIRAGHANTFLSPGFAGAFATVAACRQLFKTDGVQGAARGV